MANKFKITSCQSAAMHIASISSFCYKSAGNPHTHLSDTCHQPGNSPGAVW